MRTTPTPITSIEELHSKLKSLMPEGERVCIGIDGMDGVGKSHLARKLGGLLGAKVISLDDYLNRKQDAYIPHIRCHDVKADMAASSGPLIVEGVCLRAVADRCNIPIDIHVYVRSISHNSGMWNDDDVGLAETAAEELKQRDRALREAVSHLDEGYTPAADDSPTLSDELIDYHAEWRPYQRADVVYDVEDERVDLPE